jgi:hypothetical protein
MFEQYLAAVLSGALIASASWFVLFVWNARRS